MRNHWWQIWRPKTDNPGSQEAARAGCLCPVGLNNNGAKRPQNGWVVRTVCPMHGEVDKGARPLTEGQ